MAEDDVQEKYPRVGDKLFAGSSGMWKLNAYVQHQWDFDPAWGRYTDGYKTAAEAARKRLDEDHTLRDSLVFPIIFLYRHHFELCLKSILVYGNAYLKQSVAFPATHDLIGLWKQARVLLECHWGCSPKVDAVDAMLIEFNRFDAGSYSYRYPVRQDGTTPSHPAKDPNNPQEAFEMVNLDHFCKVADRMSNFLGECAYGFWCDLAAEDDARVAALGY